MVRKALFHLMVAIYALAGMYHFINPDFYLNIMPPWLPFPAAMVAISGLVEILLAIGLLYQPTRKASAWLIIAMLVAFFLLIHVPMSIDYYQSNNTYLMIALIRLPLQGILIYWAWLYTKAER